MKRPYRTPGTGIHNATRYHDTKGRPIFSSGRLRYGRVPYDTTPRGVRLAGQPVGATGWPVPQRGNRLRIAKFFKVPVDGIDCR